MRSLTNYEAQKIINSNKELLDYVKIFEDIKEGSGDMAIHKFALKSILEELIACRIAGSH